MGTNSGPHVANIYLHQYEFDYFTYLLENNLVDELKKLQYVFRFQDDLISFNDDNFWKRALVIFTLQKWW